MSNAHAAFELGMHVTFKSAGAKTKEQAAGLFKVAEDLLAQRRAVQTTMAAYELGLRKTAADAGLTTKEAQDAFVEAAHTVAREKLAKSRLKKDLQELGVAGTVGGLAGAQLGAPVGMINGMLSDADRPEQSRLAFIIRKLLRGTAVGGAAGVGAGVGGVAGSHLGDFVGAGKKTKDVLKTIGAVTGGSVGGIGTNKMIDKLSKDKSEKKIPHPIRAGLANIGGTVVGMAGTERLLDATKNYHNLHGLTMPALGAISAGGILSGALAGHLAGGKPKKPSKINELKAYLQEKLSSEKTAGLGTLIGSLVGAGRKKDPGENRGQAILRSGATGLAADVGSGVGAGVPTLAAALATKLKGTPHAATPLATILGGGLGAAAGYGLAARKEPKATTRQKLIALLQAGEK